MDAKKKNQWRMFFMGLLAMICFALYCSAVALSRMTFVNPVVPFAGAALISVISGVTLWRIWVRLTGSDKFVWNYICHVVAFTGFLAGIFYILNFAVVDKDSIISHPAVVEKKYSETRYHSRRISRRVYGRGAPYQVYCLELRFGGGRQTGITLPYKEYSRIRKGDTLDIPVGRGLFGIDVIKRNAKDIDVPVYDRTAPLNPVHPSRRSL